MNWNRFLTFCTVATLGFTLAARAEVPADLQARIDAKVKELSAIASDPAIVSAVKKHNAGLTADEAAMTQEKWKSLSVLDPFVRQYSKNEAGVFLKSKKDDVLTEAFVSGADGKKVAFLAKTSNWSHAGKAKHDKPMKNEKWQGDIEIDDSTGQQQIQVAIPVSEEGKPIGSLVFGLSISKLKN